LFSYFSDYFKKNIEYRNQITNNKIKLTINAMTETFKLHVTDYLDKAFPNKELPMNAIIEKGKCGIGGTYMELKNKNRKSVIVVPTIGIIEDKIDAKEENEELKYPNLYAIYGKMNQKEISDYLINVQPQKIIITPDSLRKFIESAQSVQGLWERIKHEYVLLFDEFHAIITEAFRNKMIDAFEQLFEFENQSFISATPYYFSDPRMRNFDNYKITFYEKFGIINIVLAFSVKAALNAILTGEVETAGNVHIFYNSVREIADVVNYAELKDCNIYCANKPENKEKLGNAARFFNPKPTTGKYKKFNFYTSKYFEGWDLEDNNCTIVLVTDIHSPHTKVGISNKGVQAVGRIRTKPNQPETYPAVIYHLTNHFNKLDMQPLQYFKNKYFFNASKEIKSYNGYTDCCKSAGFEPLKEKTEFVEKFANVNSNTGKAIINYTKTDQIINESACNEVFNHIKFIKEAWEKANYDTRIGTYLELRKPKEFKRLTKLTVKEIIKMFKKLKPKFEFIFNSEETEKQLNQLISKYPDIYNLYKNLTIEEMESVNYDLEEMQKLFILKNNKDAEIKVMKILPLSFSVGERYIKNDIKIKLQKIYNESGYIEKVKAEDLKNKQWYEVKECKIRNKSGKYDNGFEIIRPEFPIIISNK
jgi:hypothetical protein